MNKSCYNRVCGQNDNIDMLLLVFGLDYHSFEGTLVDAQIVNNGEGVMFFTTHDVGFLDLEDDELFQEKIKNPFIGEFLEIHMKTPPMFLDAFKDVWEMEMIMNDNKFISCGERALIAYNKIAELRPSVELKKQQEKMQEAAKEAMKLAELDEAGDLEASNVRAFSSEEVPGELPEQAIVGLQDTLKSQQIADIGNGNLSVR